MTIQSVPQVRKSSRGVVDFTKEQAWLEQHRQQYIGQWVVLAGDRLIGHGDDPRPLVAQARAEGVRIPFVHFIPEESEPFIGGWL